MSDFEDRIRNSLRPAATMPVPVVPLDPEEIAERAAHHRPPRTTSVRVWMAVAAAIVLVAGIGLATATWPNRTGSVRATPAAPPAQNTVLIDIFSGRENPRVALDAKFATELYLMLADHEVAGLLKPGDPPNEGTGFRGFVITPADSSLPALRILPTAVYFNRSGTPQRLDDPSMLFYNRVYDAIRPLIADDIRAALPETNPAIPTVTATIPPQRGATATWTLVQPKDVDTTASSIEIAVTRLECASGKTGRIMKPVVSFGASDIVIRADAVLTQIGAATCQNNDNVIVTVPLTEPIGNRTLVDAACMGGPALRTSDCKDGATRWTP